MTNQSDNSSPNSSSTLSSTGSDPDFVVNSTDTFPQLTQRETHAQTKAKTDAILVHNKGGNQYNLIDFGLNISSPPSSSGKISTNRTVKQPMVVTTTAEKPFEKVFLDIFEPLTISQNVHSYILTIQDDITKLSAAAPLFRHDANSVIQAFVEKFIYLHGISGSIVTDSGTEFMSKIFKECCKTLRIEKMNPFHIIRNRTAA